MSPSGFKPIQAALLGEAIVNIYGVVAISFDPSSLLVLILPPTTAHSGPLKVMVHWIAALTLGITPAILLCIPNAPHQTAARRSLYTAFLGFEACMVLSAASDLYLGHSGLTEHGLIGTMAVFGFFTLLRVFFLYVKPSWMASDAAVKSKST